MTTPGSALNPDVQPLLDSLADPFFVVDGGWRYTYVNVHAAGVMGVTPPDLVGRVLWECFPEALDTRLNEEYHHVMTTREVRHFELHYPALNVWVEVKAFPHADGIAVHFRDITARKLADERREALLAVTQALSRASTERDVAEAALRVGLPILGAYGGMVLCLGDQGDTLEVVHGLGYDEDARAATWRSVPLTAPLPAADAVRGARSVFVREREMPALYPTLHAQKAARTQAVAALPLVVDGLTLGALTLIFDTDRTFNDAERDFAASLAGQLAQALVRARLQDAQTRAAEQLRDLNASLETRVEERTAALTAFAVFTETSTQTTDVLTLATMAKDVLRAALSGVSVGYYELEAGRWKARVLSEDVPEPVVQSAQAGFPADLPSFARPFEERGAVFVDGWDAEREGAEDTEVYTAAALYPYFEDDEPRRLLTIASPTTDVWTERERRVFLAVARSLELAFGRARQTSRLAEQNAQLDARTKALSAFAELSRDLALEGDRVSLVGRAQDIVVSLLPSSVSTYYELSGDMWRLCSHRGEFRSARLLDALRRGLPRGATVNVDSAFDLREPYYQDRHDPDTVSAAREEITVIRTSAAFPVRVNDTVCGVLAVGLHEARPWTPVARVLLETILRNLSLALERAESVAQLAARTRQLGEERAALAAFVTYTETVGTDSDTVALAREALTVLRARFPHSSAAYYEPEGELWRARAWTDDMRGDVLAMIQAGVPADLPLFATAIRTRRAVFVDAWDPQQEGVEVTDEYGSGSAYPLIVAGELKGLLLVGLRHVRQWRERDRALVSAVGRGLNLALERGEQTSRLEAQRAELDARTKALEGFADLTRDLSVETDKYMLIRRAQEVVMSLMPAGYALYYEREGGLWRNKVQHGELGTHPEQASALQAVVDAGFPYDAPRSLVVPWTTGRPFYQDEYLRGGDTDAALVQHVHTVATLTVTVGGEGVGVLAFVLFEKRKWTNTDRAVIETVVRSLGLTLERAAALRTLEATQQRLNTVAKHAPLILFALDERGVFVVSEGRGLDALGLHPGEVVGKSAFDVYAGAPDVLDSMDRALAGEEVNGILNVGTRAFETWYVPIRDGADTVTGVVGVAVDVTERHRAEEALRRANEQLLRSNRELEQFAYVASHDLKAPLRTVTSYAQLLQRQYAGRLDDKADKYITFMVDAVAHMNILVEDVLSYSRVGRETRVANVDTERVLRDVLSNVQGTLEERGAVVTHDALPAVQADETQLRQVLQNLIGNAVKFQPRGRVPEVHVHARRQGRFVEFAVRDNGIGIAPQYFERIFGVFQRLHTREAFSGTGIGLAIVKKVVEEHGGRIWVESREGEGTTFHFTFPAAEAPTA